MSKHKDSSIYIKEMIRACIKIQEYVENTNEEEFSKQRESFDAVYMQCSHLGEQVANLEKSKDRIIQHFPDEVNWHGLKGLRNKIDHAYASIDAKIIWDFVSSAIGDIEDELKRILKKRFGERF